jgi:DNA/RNA-binding domain of Phe-tRNA-synthetase-like protein
MRIRVDPHPLLRVDAFLTRFPAPLQQIGSAAAALLRTDAVAPVTRSEALRQAVRSMLRHGGYRPAGRGKPASEYLVRAVADGSIGSINAAVDVCNVVSLHSGFPISLVDVERVTEPLRIAVAPAGAACVFNRAGHEIDLAGLVCLFDAAGPCANAVRDAQRTKTAAGTTATLSVIWGVAGYEAELTAAAEWYRSLLAGLGAATEAVTATAG